MDETLPSRPCGDCAICCIVKPIDTPTFAKAPGIACEHCTGQGCGIYETRFEICRTYRCAWKYLDWLPETLRPDLSGVLIDIVESAEPGYELEAVLLAHRGPADFQRNPIPDVIASLIEQDVLTQIARPGPPGMLNAKTALNAALGEAVRMRDGARFLAQLDVAAKTLEGHRWEPFRSKADGGTRQAGQGLRREP